VYSVQRRRLCKLLRTRVDKDLEGDGHSISRALDGIRAGHSTNTNQESILRGSDDGVMHFEESCFRTSSIVQCFSLKQRFGN
jgi:hypothetical protein